MSPEKALYELFCDLFAAHELHRFIQHHFKRLARDLPEGTSIANLAHAVAGLLQRHGHITLDRFEHLAAAAAYTSPPTPVIASTATTSPIAAPETWHAFISYAAADAVEVRRIAENLHRLGLDVFFDEWEIDAGTVVSLRLDQGLRGSRTGVLIISPTSVQRPWVLQEYTVLLDKAVKHGQRLIPVLLRDADLAPMLATRRHIDLRGKHGDDYLTAIHELAAAIRGEKPPKPPRGAPLQAP